MKAEIEYLGNVSITVEDWYKESAYPARCITSDYTTWTTYISRKAVPAGTEITNLEYWKPIARLNQEILTDYNTFKEHLLTDLTEYENMLKEDYETYKGNFEETWESYKQSALETLTKFEDKLKEELDKEKDDFIKDITASNDIIINEGKEIIKAIENEYGTIKEELVNTNNRITHDYSTTKESVLSDIDSAKSEIVSVLNTFKVNISNRIEELEEQMKTFLATAEGGTALSSHFGNSELIGVTQKALTAAINQILNRISEVTGEYSTGVGIEIIPNRVDASDKVIVNITGSSEFVAYEFIKVFIDENEVISLTDTIGFNETIEITKTSVVKVIASILGVQYEEEKTIYVYYPFFVGAGNVYTDIAQQEFARSFNNTPQGAYKIKVEDGQRIFVIINTAMADKIEQIEMNDFNIPMDVTTVDDYTVYTSKNTYVAGEYMIDINY